MCAEEQNVSLDAEPVRHSLIFFTCKDAYFYDECDHHDLWRMVS